MKVSIYQDPRGHAIGGGDYCLAVLARNLTSFGHEVDVFHHQGEDYLSRLSSGFGITMNVAKDHPLPVDSCWSQPEVRPWRRGHAMKQWMRFVSEGYDGFVCMTHGPPPFCHAKKGIAYVHFPYQIKRAQANQRSLKTSLGDKFHAFYWKGRISSFEAIIANSNFTKEWIKRYWDTDALVIHPPVELSGLRHSAKENRIIVLGRFTPAKKQLELLKLFRNKIHLLSGWKLVCVGGVDESNLPYYRALQELRCDNVSLIANADRQVVIDELSRAKVFWHAMGIDEDEQNAPIKSEHFGIATVEAMAAGCIPIVANRGGQREIVCDGINGFLCDSIDEFADRLLAVIESNEYMNAVSQSAMNRALRFERSVFEAKMHALIR